jgi:ankyrin repeat protein
MSKDGININSKNDLGNTALINAVLDRDVETVKLLLSKDSFDINSKDEANKFMVHFFKNYRNYIKDNNSTKVNNSTKGNFKFLNFFIKKK